jgi:hypothetical protein
VIRAGFSAAIATILAAALTTAPGVARAQAPKPAEKLPEKLSGDQIKENWFNGKAFTATAPDGSAFLMTFNPDGKSSRKPVEKKKGVTSAAGFWRVIAEGYCSRWSGQNREKCFNVRPDPDNPDMVIVRFGPQLVANWKR